MRSFLDTLRRLALGAALILAAAGFLLYSDLASRNRTRSAPTAASRVVRVGLIQHASQGIIDDGARGVVEALRGRGYAEGGRLQLRRYNAEGDLPTAHAIAKEVTSAGYDLIITLTTLSTQTVANANRSGSRTRHVFGLVTDPYGSGLDIDREDHAKHPPYLTGYGSFQPIEAAFQLAREMRPELKTVGIVWNPTEVNSLLQVVKAREVCRKLGITLVEVSADSSAGVGESAAALTSRGVEAIWINGDVTVMTAADAVVAAARRARIPVFTVMPPVVDKGGLFDVGPDYTAIGRAVGELAADVLDGRSPADIPVENFAPEMVAINHLALDGLRDRWQVPPEAIRRATLIIDAKGRHVKSAQAAKPLGRRMSVDLIEYIDTPNVEITREGLLAGFEQAGLVPGRDIQLRRRNAQGDIATLSSIIDSAVTENTDLLLTSSTPALQGALRRSRGKAVVFALVASPTVAGAGTSDTDHLPFVTGAYIPAPHEEALAALQSYFPNLRRIGTLYTPAEVNSVYYKERLEAAAKAAGVELVTVGVNASGDLADAALAMCGRDVDVFFQISDNLTGAGFTSIAQAAARCRLPLVGFAAGQAAKGAMMTVSRDYYDGGIESALIAARVLRGESPAVIPFKFVAKIRFAFNLQSARRLGIKIPPELLARAEEVIR
jgi:ABC-type uncharacterized transport system substrate-binding protein